MLLRGQWVRDPSEPAYWNLSCPLEWSKYSCVHMGNVSPLSATPYAALSATRYTALSATPYAVCCTQCPLLPTPRLVHNARCPPVTCMAPLQVTKGHDARRRFEPKGCVLSEIDPEELVAALGGRNVYFLGDSLLRQ
eukprot:3233066-Rhodomonas_salina.2